jgi:hypothetical protein
MTEQKVEENKEPSHIMYIIFYMTKKHKKIDIMKWCKENDLLIKNMVDHLGKIYIEVENNVAKLSKFRSLAEEAKSKDLFSSFSTQDEKPENNKNNASMKRK